MAEAQKARRTEHVISFYWDGYVPHLETFHIQEGSFTEVDLSHVEMEVFGSRRCIGRFDPEGYHPCPSGSVVKGFTQCSACASAWIPNQECIFEPKCDGEECDSEFCRRPHAIYAAFTGGAVKIGMTSEKRIIERGTEQGADAIAPLIDCRSRREARYLEKKVSMSLGLPQISAKSEIVKSLCRPPGRAQLERSHREVVNRLSRLGMSVRNEIEILDGYPVRELPTPPIRAVDATGLHDGDVLLVKGRHLVYRRKADQTPLLLDLSSLPSRFIRRPSRK